MKKLFYILYLLPALVLGQSSDQNYTKVISYRAENAGNPQTQVTYYDGLGRPIQQVANAQSNGGKDIITHMEYDAFGRQTKEFLPYANQAASLDYNSGAATEVLSFYNTTAYESTANPYSEKLLEASPLNRIYKQAAPGNEWGLGSGHEIKMDYQTNTATEVIFFKANAVWDPNKGLFDISLGNPEDYGINQLYKTITKDENNNTTEEFKDKEGRVVLKRTYNNGDKHDTYYVYDIYGNLTYVIPPLVNTELQITDKILNGLCYQYKYDYRNRLVEKKLPGKQWEFIVYDKINRPIATGPVYSPYGDESSGVLITEYDAFGRVTKTGWLNYTINESQRSSLQTTVNNGSNPFVLTENDILTKNFYDNYAFTGAPEPVPTLLPDSTYPIASYVKGYATGSWVRVITTASELNGELSYTLYDTKYRPVRVYTKNYIGGYTQVDTKLDFMGKTEYTITRHKRTDGVSEIVVKDMFTYTAQDRLALHKQKINELEEQLIVSNTYDELGQLTSKNVGGGDTSGASGLQKVDYTYNIRGWLKTINDVDQLNPNVNEQDFFAFKINYDNPDSTVGRFNGNISETYWRTKNDNILRKYSYVYDDLNRLLDATYHKLVSNTPIDSYNENIKYDKNGNIKDLFRNGNMDSDGMMGINNIDDLVYYYDADDGNKLMKVYDKSASPQGFNEIADVNSGDIDYNTNTDASDDYEYDNNGNMTVDKNKGIDKIVYNHLNLPVKIFFGNGNSIEYIYSAAGQKFQKKIIDNIGGYSDITNYLNGFQYKNGVLQFFPHPEGYVNYTPQIERDQPGTLNYVFNYTDHLGNVRLSYGIDPSTNALRVIEENHYYPFGLKHTNYNSDWLLFYKETSGVVSLRRPPPVETINLAPPYKYKYNGKELQDELGLNVYDYGWRNYMPDVGRWTQMDPLLNDLKFSFDDSKVDEDDEDEVYNAMVTKLETGEGIYNTDNLNPYGYGYNNPVSFDDPDGRCPACIYLVAAFLYSQFANAPTGDKKLDTRNRNATAGNDGIVSAAVLTRGVKIGTNAVKEKVVEKVTEKAKQEKTGKVSTSPKNAESATKERTAKDPLRRDKNGEPAADPEAKGTSHTQLGTKEGRKGNYKQGREFDKDGKPVRDVDHTDHGRPSNHPNPHQHRYEQNTTGGTRKRGGTEPLD